MKDETGTHVDAVIVGLGYVGLPIAQEATRAGLVVRGYDLSAEVVTGLMRGKSHVDDLSDGDVAEMLTNGFAATSDSATLSSADVVVICVPTPLNADGGPDLAAVRGASRDIAKNLVAGQTIILESTTYPGTTEEIVQPILETSGLRAGKDFSLAFSPERIDPGNKKYGAKNTPKVVGGIDKFSTAAASSFYARFVDTVVETRGTREAEMTKLLENTYRHINIALVNEMARFCHELGIDLWDVIRAASTKPFGFQAFYPGPGVGGHCIPIDPNYLSHNVRSRLGYPFRFVELAQEINAGMPAYVVQRVQNMLNDDAVALNGATVLLLGVTYKANIADQRESPARHVARHLLEKGAKVQYHDPFVDEWRVDDAAMDKATELMDAARSADIVVLLQKHDAYDVDELALVSRAMLDTRGATSPESGASNL